MYGTEDDTRHVGRGPRFGRRHEERGVAEKNMRMKNALEWSSSCMYVLADGSSACMRGSNDPCACMHGSSNDGVLSMHVRVLAKGELACVNATLEAEEAGAARLQASSSRRRREV